MDKSFGLDRHRCGEKDVWSLEKNMFGKKYVWKKICLGKQMFLCEYFNTKKKIFDQLIFLSRLGHTKSVAMLHDWYKYRARYFE